MDSDVRAGTYMIVVAEGIKNASAVLILWMKTPLLMLLGTNVWLVPVNYVCQQLIKRLKADTSIPEI